ncbi:50S ribosomal protein L11 methyltransferase [Thermodesulfobacteriota bacterium]
MSNIDTIKQILLQTVATAYERRTPLEWERLLSRKFQSPKKMIKAAIRSLVHEGELAYSYTHGCSFLVRNFERPVRISEHIILKPPVVSYERRSEDLVVELQAGASFGDGQHPSTRLALRGIEYALTDKSFAGKNKKLPALDIGTGSGVLVIAAVLLGIATAVAIDTDPCARAEAKFNVKLNNLENRIEIDDRPIEKLNGRYCLISANLRYPTLKKLYPQMQKMVTQQGHLVLSGIKAEEVAGLLNLYTKSRFDLQWQETEQDWAGVVLQKR